MSAIENGTLIGKPRTSGKRYLVLVEYRDEDLKGLEVDVVCDTGHYEVALLMKQTLDQMLERGIFDIRRVVEFYIEEDPITDNTVVADNVLTDLLTTEKHYEEGMDDPLRALLKLIYAMETPQ